MFEHVLVCVFLLLPKRKKKKRKADSSCKRIISVLDTRIITVVDGVPETHSCGGVQGQLNGSGVCWVLICISFQPCQPVGNNSLL